MRKTKEEIVKMYDDVKTKVVVGGLYAHHSNSGKKAYKVVGVGLMEDTWEPLVMYEDLGSGVRTVHKLDDFLKKEIDGKMVDRFVLVK